MSSYRHMHEFSTARLFHRPLLMKPIHRMSGKAFRRDAKAKNFVNQRGEKQCNRQVARLNIGRRIYAF